MLIFFPSRVSLPGFYQTLALKLCYPMEQGTFPLKFSHIIGKLGQAVFWILIKIFKYFHYVRSTTKGRKILFPFQAVLHQQDHHFLKKNSYSLFMSKYVWLYNFIFEHSFSFRSKSRVIFDIKPMNFVSIYMYIYRSRIFKGSILNTKIHAVVQVNIYCLEGCNSDLNMKQLLRQTPQRFHTNK